VTSWVSISDMTFSLRLEGGLVLLILLPGQVRPLNGRGEMRPRHSPKLKTLFIEALQWHFESCSNKAVGGIPKEVTNFRIAVNGARNDNIIARRLPFEPRSQIDCRAKVVQSII